jgi:hypothetical protein
MYEYRTYFTGEITLHVAQIVNTEQLQHYYPRNMVCFGYITVNTLKSVMKLTIIVIRKYCENYAGWDSLLMLLTITI